MEENDNIGGEQKPDIDTAEAPSDNIKGDEPQIGLEDDKQNAEETINDEVITTTTDDKKNSGYEDSEEKKVNEEKDKEENIKENEAPEKEKPGKRVQLAPLETNQQKPKKLKKSIYISYSPDAGYLERKFVVETVREFKDNNLAEDIHFDKDENNIVHPCWFSLRLEAAEKCKAAILFLSDSYFTCPVSIYESKIFIERLRKDSNGVKLFPVLWSALTECDLPAEFRDCAHFVDLTRGQYLKYSCAEKTSVVVGSLMEEVEKYAVVFASPATPVPVYSDKEPTDNYKKKKVCQWLATDLQDWLFALGIKEFYRLSLAESLVDGFLLMSLTDHEMVQHLGIDSRVVRKKMMQQILVALDKEHKLPESWHLRARTVRAKPNSVYIVYDPTDVRMAQSLKRDLSRKGISVFHHQNLGQSKDEFLLQNGPTVATSTHILVLMTDAAVNSPFVFHEIMFADWLGKKLVTAMFRNTWDGLRPSLKAVLGDCVAIDFETKMYNESMDVLEHYVRPMKVMPGVVLEQAYLNKMADGLQHFGTLANETKRFAFPDENEPKVFISYQWDVQSKVDDIRHMLESNGFPCWADISTKMTRSHSSISNRNGATSVAESTSETLQGQIQRIMRASSVVLCCITPKYMQSDNSSKDLALADSLRKPIVPVMLRYIAWPPDGNSSKVRKILSRCAHVDLSNDKLYKMNMRKVLEAVYKVINQKK
ncbi:uncharacterized protein LOC141900130 [Tubulanus polymorphus]|uniref:uncharacterized protein LOC141900130 n=1 Tax=Tubulanus polymorphus TaxID=672921 RepID=UPI003DA3D4C8